MPDTLPPLEDIPDDLLTKPLNPTSSAGAWAATFGGSDTNLAQRRRHNEDLVQHGAAVQAAQKAHFMDELGRDKVKQDLYFRQKTLDSTIANRENALAQRQQQFDAKLAAQETVNKVKGELGVAQLDLAKTRAEAAANAAKVKMDLAASEAADTTALTNDFLAQKAEGKFRVGTPEMADALIELRAKHPAVGKNTFGALWAGTNQNVDAETYATKKAQAAAQLAGTQARTAATVAGEQAKTDKADAKILTDDERLLQGYAGQRTKIKPTGKDGAFTSEEKSKVDLLDSLINETKARVSENRGVPVDDKVFKPNIEIKIKDGKKYEVNHDTKSVKELP